MLNNRSSRTRRRAPCEAAVFDVDDQGYKDVVAVLAEALERVVEIQAESANRAAAAPGKKRRRTEIAILHFEPTTAAAERRAARRNAKG